MFFALFGGRVAVAETEIPTTIDSRIKTIIYNPNEIIELTFHYGFQSFIELEEDEEIDIISLGESFPWKITPVGKRLFIRPLQINTNTNMTLITNKRTYMFQLKSDSYEGKGDEELIYSVRFFYPSGVEKIPSMKGAKYADFAAVNPQSTEDNEMVLNNFRRGTVLNFDYSMTGENGNIKLRKAFDDGISTYFEFGDKKLVPEIYYVDLNGRESLLKYFRDGPYIVVNTVQMQFSFRAVNDILCVFNNSMLY
ncbi:MAG: TrbG/VirB9 family P-type conjugative transfer protein [Rickettsiales bacterium]|jgi:type IV secretion system protein VirB9|nr:TrbG/VirB9 family P-type conjugative transfer protein [Rickettsiales bacterium]